jgi:hypothetical protein
MTKNIQLTVGLMSVVALVSGFLAWQHAHRAYIEETTTLLHSVPAGEVTGIITKLSGNTLTLAPNLDDLGVPEDMPETLIYTLTPDTKVIRYVRVVDTEAYQEAMAVYTEAIANDPESMAMPPAPFEVKEYTQETLAKDQTVSIIVSTKEDRDHIVAEGIVIRYDAPTQENETAD